MSAETPKAQLNSNTETEISKYKNGRLIQPFSEPSLTDEILGRTNTRKGVATRVVIAVVAVGASIGFCSKAPDWITNRIMGTLNQSGTVIDPGPTRTGTDGYTQAFANIGLTQTPAPKNTQITIVPTETQSDMKDPKFKYFITPDPEPKTSTRTLVPFAPATDFTEAYRELGMIQTSVALTDTAKAPTFTPTHTPTPNTKMTEIADMVNEATQKAWNDQLSVTPVALATQVHLATRQALIYMAETKTPKINDDPNLSKLTNTGVGTTSDPAKG